MPFISDQSIDLVRRQVSIVDVVGRVTQLKKAGRQWRALSPFTSEKSPSFYVNPDKNVWFCYSSGKGGDVIGFVREYEKLNFNEAVEALAERYHITLEYQDGGSSQNETRSLKKQLLELHEAVTDYYREKFFSTLPDAVATRSYWTDSRRFSLDIAKEWHIGFAPSEPGDLMARLLRAKFTPEAIRSCGLFYVPERETDITRWRHRFRGRLMIPIRDSQGRVIAFTARVLPVTPEDDPSREAKYVNSPETPLFVKGDLVFGLDRAKDHVADPENKNRRRFLLVEGQLDCIRCQTHGLTHTVAPQGTAITENQMRLLKRYADHLDVLLDGDNAGQKGAFRMLPLALAAGHEVRFLPLPPKTDPDSLLASEGAGALPALQANSRSAMDFACSFLLPEGPRAGAQEKAGAFTQLCEIIAAAPSSVAQESYLDEICRIWRLDPRGARRDFGNWQRRSTRPSTPSEEPSNPPSLPSDQRLTTVEHDLLLLVFNHEALGTALSQLIHDEWIDHTHPHGRLLARVLAEFHEGLWQNPATVPDLCENEEDRNLAYRLLAHKACFEEPVKHANCCLSDLVKRHVTRRLEAVNAKLQSLPFNDPAVATLQNEVRSLRALRSKVPQLSLS